MATGDCETARNWRRCTGILEAIQVILGETRALRWAEERLYRTIVRSDVCLIGVSLCVNGAHLVPDGVVFGLFCIVFVEVDDIHGSLWVLFLLLLGDAILLQHALPFLGKALASVSGRARKGRIGIEKKQTARTCRGGRRIASRRATYRELARLVVDADVGDVHGVGGRGDGRPPGRAQHAAHKGREGALLLPAVGPSLLGRVGLITVSIARALSAGWRGIHFARCGGKGRRLAQLRRREARGLVCCVRMRWASRSTWPSVTRGVESFLDNGVEGCADRRRRKVGKRGGQRTSRLVVYIYARGALVFV